MAQTFRSACKTNRPEPGVVVSEGLKSQIVNLKANIAVGIFSGELNG
jgi:hypothetical protein